MTPLEEAERLYALRQLRLLDTPASESFDRITRMATRLFDLPISAVSLTDQDRQWFKSRVGVDNETLPRWQAPCAEVAQTRGLLVIPDLLAHPDYADSPLAKAGVRFYAGAPLVTGEGYGLGAMCVLGVEPRQATEAETDSLQDLAAMVMAQIELQHAFGRIDPLTGLPNATQLADDLDDLARDGGRGAARRLVLVELATAEQHDRLLRARGPGFVDAHVRDGAQAIVRLVGQVGQVYQVARTGFAFMSATDMPDADYVPYVAQMLARSERTSVSRFVTTTAVGIAPLILGEGDVRDTLRAAFTAVADARGTESRVGLYSTALDDAQRRRHRLVDNFGAVLETGLGLSLVYQPRIDLATGCCVGVEALLRWRHAELGDVSPGEFIPLVEQTNLAGPTTEWVLTCAAEQLAEWLRRGLDLTVSVNISAANLQQPDFVERVLAIVSAAGAPVSRVELELTESSVMGDPRLALEQMHRLAAAGVSLAIDDFGTGYSSLSYLQQLPARVVKIDQSFVRAMADDERQRGLVGAMISLSHNLGCRVVAEGIETAEIGRLLEAAHCDEAQGYHYARPMPPAAFETWLIDGSGGRALRRSAAAARRARPSHLDPNPCRQRRA